MLPKQAQGPFQPKFYLLQHQAAGPGTPARPPPPAHFQELPLPHRSPGPFHWSHLKELPSTSNTCTSSEWDAPKEEKVCISVPKAPHTWLIIKDLWKSPVCWKTTHPGTHVPSFHTHTGGSPLGSPTVMEKPCVFRSYPNCLQCSQEPTHRIMVLIFLCSPETNTLFGVLIKTVNHTLSLSYLRTLPNSLHVNS